MKRKIIAVLTFAIIILSTLPVAFANDIKGHWAEKYIKYLDEQNVINPSVQTGNYSPDDVISRAEFMRYINRAFHFTETAEINYSDVSKDAWYYETVKIAERYGYINGVGNNKMNPEGDITREQAATIIGRLYKTTDANAVKPNQLTFTDKNQISSWSAGYIYEAVQKGYIAGYPDGTFKPKNNIKRSEIARILYSYLGTALSKEGEEYKGSDLKKDVENVTISEACTLSSAEIGGDLYITEGIDNEKVVLKDVTMRGTLIISGGNVTLENVDAPTIIVGSSIKKLVKVNATGSTNVSITNVQSTASFIESKLDISSGGFSDVAVYGDEKTTVAIDGSLWKLDVFSPAAITLSNASEINTLNINEACKINGYGKILQANINKNGSNISIIPENYQLAEGVTATINGSPVSKKEAVTIKPDQFTWDRGRNNRDETYDFVLSVSPETLTSINLEGRELILDEDYTKTLNGIRIARTFFDSIKTEGNYVLNFSFANGITTKLNIAVINSSKNTIEPSGGVFDKNKQSQDYKDLVFKINKTSDTSLEKIVFAGRTLSIDDEYTYDASSGVVEIKTRYLNNRSNGTYNVTFYMTRNNSITASIIIKDSTPKNTLSLEKIDFDINNYGANIEDPKVTINSVGGAKLKRINALDTSKVLDEGWQYVISETGEVTIKSSALESLASDGRSYINLEFEMSRGVSPVLRVNFVTTYSVRVNVCDDKGTPVKNANVIIKPQDLENEALSKEQQKATDDSGVATFYVRSGMYEVIVDGENFERKSQSVNVSYSQSVEIKADIQEVVKIAVTEQSGAYVNGAVVTLGKQKVTTGVDGIATFKIERGKYNLTIVADGYNTYLDSNFNVETSSTIRIKL